MTGGGEQNLFLVGGYKYLKTIKSDTRNRMGHDQSERLWLLSAHLPDLQSFDVSKVVAALK